jgi:RHS repeat-associated protein
MTLPGLLRQVTSRSSGGRARSRARRAARRVTAALLAPVLAAGTVTGVVPAVTAAAAITVAAAASVATAAPARAATGQPVLVLDQNGETTAPESAALQAAGYQVTQVTPAQWEAMSTSQFQAYVALVIGDPSAGGSCSTLAPTTGSSGSDALGTTWQGAVTGNVAVLGTAPALPGTTAATTLITDSVGYAAAGYSSSASTGTGLYISLNCEYATAAAGTPVPLLAGVESIGADGGLAVAGNLACTDPGSVNAWEAAGTGTFGGFTSASLSTSSWGTACPVDEGFTSWPAMFTPVAYDAATDATGNFTASDGTTGQPYILLGAPVSTATAALAPSVGGEVIGGTTAGGTSNPAAPGVQQASAGDPVNTENGDFTQTDTDESLPGFGPSLAFTRTYDADQAQAQTQEGAPGAMGYGWTDNWASTVSGAQPTPGDIYLTDGLRIGGDGGPATQSVMSDPGEVVVDAQGDIFFADTGDNRVQEIAGPDTTREFGQAMVPGDVYTVAGQSGGTSSPTMGAGMGNGILATTTYLAGPRGVTVDAAGNLFISDTNHCRVIEVSPQTGDESTVAGVPDECGTSANGQSATGALLTAPAGLHMGQGSDDEDLYIADGGTNRILEVSAQNETAWGLSMTGGDMYTVAGSSAGLSGKTGNGTQAQATRLLDPEGVTINGSNMYIADTDNCRILEIPGAAGSAWGVSGMKADDSYTVAGGTCGDGAPGGAAVGSDLDQPASVRDPNGNLYISDTGNFRIMEVAGTTHSEWGQSMTADDIYEVGDGISNGVWMDGSGNLYWSFGTDNGNTGSQILELPAGSGWGEWKTLAGTTFSLADSGDDGPATLAGLNDPGAVGADKDGDTFIADTGNNRIQEIPASSGPQFGQQMTAGVVYTIAGLAFAQAGDSADGTPADSSELNAPAGVATDRAGDVFIADTGNGIVQEIPVASGTQFGQAMTAGDIYTIAGTAGAQGPYAYSYNGGPATSAILDSPAAIATDTAGDLFIDDSGNNDVFEVPAASGTQRGVAMTAGDIYLIAGSIGTAPSAAPTGLTVTGTTSTSVSLSWTAPAGSVSSYMVYVNGNAATTSPATVTGTTATVTGLTQGTTYSFTVAADNSAGPGALSAPVSGTTAQVTPAAPTGLTVTGTTSTSVSLSWTAPAGGVSGYYVYEDGSATALLSSAVTVTGTTATVTGLSASTAYTFTVAAWNSGGTSAQSSSAPATTGVPAAPAGLSVTGSSATGVSLSWTAPPGTVTGYSVYEDGSSTALPSSAVTVTGTTATVTGLSASTAYTFTVAAANAAGTGSQSSPVSVTTSVTAPAAPTGLAVTATATASVSLSWTAPSGTVTGYDVYMGGTELPAGAVTVTISGTTATVSGLSASTTCTFTVAATNAGGAGTQSSSVSATTGVPAAPAGLAVTATTSTSVSLSWTAPSGTVTGYDVYENGSSTALASSAVTFSGTTATVTGLSALTGYTFTVAAANAAGTGAQSSSVSATTPDGVPAAPTGLTVTSFSVGTLDKTTVHLSWTAPPGTVTGYDMYVGDDLGTPSITITGTTATVKATPSGGELLTFAVAAYNTAGTGPESSTVTLNIDDGDAVKAPAAAGTVVSPLTSAGGGLNPSGDSGDGGPATAALLDGPSGLAVDTAGDIYISDSRNNQVREIAAAAGTQWGQAMTAGDIYTVAGLTTGTSGDSGDAGPATAALLSDPLQIAVDSAGDLYIADAGNAAVREIAGANGAQWAQSMTAGDIYDVAGEIGTDGTSGNGGPATTAQVSEPYGVGTDQAGDIYLLQYGMDWAVPQLQEIAATAAPAIPAAPGETSSLYPVPGGITITQPGGSQVTFQAKETSGGCPLPDVLTQNGQYCTQADFTDATLTAGSGGDWDYTPSPGADTYTYGPPAPQTDGQDTGQLIAETDTAGNKLTITYNSPAPGTGNCPTAASSCQTITAASGRTLVIGSSIHGLVTSVTDPLGRTWTYAYNSSDQLTSATSPMSNVTSYAYGQGNTGNPALTSDLLTITAPNAQPGGPDAGDATVNVYDGLGRVTAQTDPAGWKTTFNYCVNPAAGDCMNAATGTGYVTVTDPDSNTTVDGYQVGDLVSETQHTATTVVSENDYYPAVTAGVPWGGTLLDTSTTDGDGFTSTYSYNAYGDPTIGTSPSADGPATTTSSFTSQNEPDCVGTPDASAASTCTQDAGPTAVTPGGMIVPPSSAPPYGLTWTLYDTDGNSLYSTTGVYEPGSSSASYLQTTYQLFNGNSVTLNDTTISCAAKAPSSSLPCAKINADGVITQLGYDAAGDLTSTSTPDGNGSQAAATTYAFDADGEQTSTTAPDGNVTGADAGNYTTVTVYNADGEKASATQAGGSGATATPRTTTYGYDGDGNQTTIKDARGYTTTTTYNADDKPALVTDPDGDASLTCYDGDGNTAQTVPAVGVAASRLTPASCPTLYPSGYGDRLASDATVVTYDAAGNKTEVTAPASAGQSGYETTTYTYDQDGNLVETTAPPATNGGPDQVTVDTYNGADELATQTTGYSTSAASTTSYCYDPGGKKTAVVAPDGNTSGVAPCLASYPWTVSAAVSPAQAAYQTTYSYDSAGELVSSATPVTSAAPSGATTTATYDPAGNMLTSTDPDKVTTTWTYTPGNLTASESYSGSSAPSVTYAYDADGTKTGMTDGTGTSSYTYDPFGEITSATNGNNQAVTYGYDADGDATGITYPLPSTATWATSDTVSYGYDNADHLTSVTDFTGSKIAITSTADGLPASEALGSTGDTISTSYDNADSPSAITLANSSSTLQSFSYSDAPGGQILTETDTPSSADSPAGYTYDAIGRVTSMTPGTGSTDGYGYDASSNLTTLPDGAVGTYDHDDELTSSVLSGTATGYTYNADGERLTATQDSNATATGTWNGSGQLTAYQDGAAAMSDATYAGGVLRASATFTAAGGNPVTENYVWSGDSLLMDSANAYIYAAGTTPAEQVNLTAGTITYVLPDALGSARGIISSTGALTSSMSYDAWGNPQTAGGLTATTPFGFAGGYTDPDGLIYLINRYYDPATGQFTSVDPDVATTGEPYAYADDDPVIAKDPSGLFTVGICGSLSGALGPFFLSGQGCLTKDIDSSSTPDNNEIGVTGTVASSLKGVGWGFGGSLGGGYQVSDATHLAELSSWFTYIAGGGDFMFGASADLFWGYPPLIVGADLAVGVGDMAYAQFGFNYTWVNVIHNKLQALLARNLWTTLIYGPGLGGIIAGFQDVGSLCNKVNNSINAYIQSQTSRGGGGSHGRMIS